MSSDPPIAALVSGANRGIGLEVARQLAQRGWIVFAGSRDEARGREAAAPLQADGLDVRPVRLDVADDESVARCAAQVEDDFGRLDVLVNNAAVDYDTWERAVTADLDTVREALEVNTIGALALVQACLPL